MDQHISMWYNDKLIAGCSEKGKQNIFYNKNDVILKTFSCLYLYLMMNNMLLFIETKIDYNGVRHWHRLAC